MVRVSFVSNVLFESLSLHLERRYVSVMTDSPLEIIEAQRRRVDTLRAELREAESRLQGMELIFGALPSNRRRPAAPIGALGIPSAPPRYQGGGDPTPGGRQPGAISMRWRTILAEMYRSGEYLTAQQTAETVSRIEGRPIKPSEARRILEGYVEHEYIHKNNAGAYAVTDAAAGKFGFTRGDENVMTPGADFAPPPPPPLLVPQAPNSPPPVWGQRPQAPPPPPPPPPTVSEGRTQQSPASVPLPPPPPPPSDAGWPRPPVSGAQDKISGSSS